MVKVEWILEILQSKLISQLIAKLGAKVKALVEMELIGD